MVWPQRLIQYATSTPWPHPVKRVPPSLAFRIETLLQSVRSSNRASAYSEKGDYHRAAETYIELRSKLVDSPGNYYNLIECDYNLNRCYDKLNLDKEAILSARSVNDYYDILPDKTKRRQRSKLDYLRRYAGRQW